MSPAEVVTALDVHISTDFALLAVGQLGPAQRGAMTSGVFAVSAAGGVLLQAGTKYAELNVRVEVWSGRPSPADDEWEDQDVVPWQSVDGGGPLFVSGFETRRKNGLTLDGLERGRLEVLAWGRDRYSYGDGPAGDEWTIPHERWLCRLWPDPLGLDALAGPPRRLVCREWLPPRRSAWWAAVHALTETGWERALSGVPGFASIIYALRLQRGAFRAEDLPPEHARWAWNAPVVDASQPQPSDRKRHQSLIERAAAVGRAAGVEVVTYQDALRALIELGVLATVKGSSGALLIPNPTPPLAAWDVLEMPTEPGWGHPLVNALSDYRALAQDVEHLARWAPGGVLRATPQRMASRLGVTVDDLLGALRLLSTLGRPVESSRGDLEGDAEVTVGVT